MNNFLMPYNIWKKQTDTYPIRQFNNLEREDGTTGFSTLYANGQLIDYDTQGNQLRVTQVSPKVVEDYQNFPRIDTINGYPLYRFNSPSENVHHSILYSDRQLRDYDSQGNLTGITVVNPEDMKKYENLPELMLYDKFSDAFKNARAKGLDKFSWNNKVYTTELGQPRSRKSRRLRRRKHAFGGTILRNKLIPRIKFYEI